MRSRACMFKWQWPVAGSGDRYRHSAAMMGRLERGSMWPTTGLAVSRARGQGPRSLRALDLRPRRQLADRCDVRDLHGRRSFALRNQGRPRLVHRERRSRATSSASGSCQARMISWPSIISPRIEKRSITLHLGGPRQLTEIKTLNFDKTQQQKHFRA